MKIQNNPFLAVALTSGLFLPGARAAVAPYSTADADTVHLYHFSEAPGGSVTANSGSAGLSAYTIDANPVTGATVTDVLGALGATGFGNAVNLTGKTDQLVGFDTNNSGGFQTDQSAAILSPDRVTLGSLGLGGTSPFTLEALVNTSSPTANRFIICTDSSATNRGFQFRITTGGSTGQRLEFNQITNTGGGQRLAEIPNSGTHAFATGTWFHAAIVFDGANCQFYWTKVDPSVVHANPLGAAQALTLITAVSGYEGPLVFGNENRAVAAEGINGLIDEVRISKVARKATQFIFSDGDDLRDDWEVQFFRENESETIEEILAKFTGSEDPDLDTFDNLAEQAAGSDPTNPLSVPGNADGDGLDDAWEMLHFGDLDEVADSDPDGDFATNEQEETAGTDPSGADGFLSFPDTEGGTGDGLSDAWEMFHFFDLDEIPGGDPDDDLYTNAEEYLLITNPDDQLSAPDGDSDGLNDGWEALHFLVSGDDRPTLLARESGASDADGDGYPNKAEETAGTNPTTAQKPTDFDGDGLIDSWEMEHFESLDPEPGDLTGDGDAFTNLQEQNAGSSPLVTASVPGDIDGDDIPDTEEAFQPYTVDSNTLHLWHLDEVDQPAANAVGGGLAMTAINANGRLWTPSLAGFGTGMNPSLGRGTANGGVLSALPLANGTADDATMTYAGADGAFTFEAIVRIDFDPAVAPASVVPMQIVTGDGDVAANRVWQFRLVPIGGPGNAAGTAPLLEFTNIRAEVGVQSIVTPLPLAADPDAIAQNGWYHVAVAYNGAEATADNIKFYWTLLDPARTAANELFSGQMTNDLIVAAPDFSIGNEARDLGGSTDSFLGVVDEVRISDVARTPSQFHFVSTETPDNLDDGWELLYFGNLDQTDSGDFDNDGTDNLTEFRLGLIPNSGSSRFAATGGAGGSIQWPSATGTTFKIERSINLGSWGILEAAYPGTAGSASYTDPAPPAGKAFYRVTLNP